MAYERNFDEEFTRVSYLACVNDGFESSAYALALTTADLHVGNLPPSIYRAFLDGMDPTLTVALTVSRTSESVSLPTPNTWGGSPTDPIPSDAPVAIFPGNQVVRVRVMSGLQTLNVRLLSGTGTLYLVPVLINRS